MATPRTVTISLPPALARKADRIARSEGRSRSELFREAIRQYLDRVDRWDQIFAFGERVAQERGLSEEDVRRAVKERRRARSR
jgi:CopG family transcriptional regulator/antitoxin EndoAI